MLHSDIEPVRDNVTDLLTRMAKEHPRALSYAIAVAAAAADDEADAAGEGFEVGGFRSNPEALAAVRERFASASRALEAIGKVKSALSATDPRLFADVTLVVSELGRLAVLHDEELLTSLQDLHGDVTSRIASIAESSEPIEDVMRPAVAELDRLVRDALSGAGFVTPHVKSFAKKYREGLLDAVNEFKGSVASDPSNGWRAVKEQMVQLARGLQRKRELRLKNLSPSLAKLESRPGGFAAPMPGDVGGDVDSILVDIVSVGSDVTVLPTKSRPKRITLLGSDGTRRVFLLKGNEDLRLDARLQPCRLRLIRSLRRGDDRGAVLCDLGLQRRQVFVKFPGEEERRGPGGTGGGTEVCLGPFGRSQRGTRVLDLTGEGCEAVRELEGGVLPCLVAPPRVLPSLLSGGSVVDPFHQRIPR